MHQIPSITVIEPPKGWVGLNWSELWRFRELLYFLIWRDLKVRYKQTALGIGWVLLQPLITMLIFTFVFGVLAGMGRQTDPIPYPIYVYASLIAWTFFANCVSHNSHAILNNAPLVTKVYFPRMLLLFSGIGGGLVDLGVAALLLLGMMAFSGLWLGWPVILLPMAVIALAFMATGLGALFAALTVTYRDFRYLVPFLLQIGLYASAVIFPPQAVPANWQWLLQINPLAGILEAFRFALLRTPLDSAHFVYGCVVSVALLFLGLAVFRRFESRFADEI